MLENIHVSTARANHANLFNGLLDYFDAFYLQVPYVGEIETHHATAS